MSWKVVVADHMDPVVLTTLRNQGIEAIDASVLPGEELPSILEQCHGLAIRGVTKVTETLLGSAPKLRVICRAGVGVDNIDLEAVRRRGIVLMNTPTATTVTTAEHTIALMMTLAKHIARANGPTHAGEWIKYRLMGMELDGKTLGLIGFGRIAHAVAQRAIGLGMKVLAYSPTLTDERARRHGAEKAELGTLLENADIISLHIPLVDSTRELIDRERIFRMKRGVRIINCARSLLIANADLKNAILEGQVAGVAIDVFDREPDPDHPLCGMEEVIMTPHLGAWTVDAQHRVAKQVGQQTAAFLLEEKAVNVIA
jgi:D-3-phosphoglycerate dehydrogenase / 2-oxoglutarate reductase